MNTRYLEEFLLFAKELNYSKAAKKLFITRPTLTEHISELEVELGCKLLAKGNGKIALSPEGKRFIRTATELLEHIQDIVDEYGNLSQNLLTVTIASTNLPWLETVLYKARRNIHERYPDKHIEIVTASGPFANIDALLEHDNDLTVAGYKSYLEELHPQPPQGIRGIFLGREEIKLLMTQDNPLFTQKHIAAHDLNGATIMLPPDIYSGYARDGVAERFAELGATISLQTSDFSDHSEYFTYDFGTAFGVVPTTLAPRFGITEREECRAFTLDDLCIKSDFFVLYKEDFVQNQNGRLLIEELQTLLEKCRQTPTAYLRP